MYLIMKQFIFLCEQEAIQYVTSKLFYIMQRKRFSFVHQLNTIMDCHLLYLIQRFTHVLIIEIFVLCNDWQNFDPFEVIQYSFIHEYSLIFRLLEFG